MNLFFVTAGCVIGVVLTTLAFLFALSLCRMAAEADPESDWYKPNDLGVNK